MLNVIDEQWRLAWDYFGGSEPETWKSGVGDYPYSNGCSFGEGMRELPGRRWTPPAELPSLPLMYSVSAVR